MPVHQVFHERRKGLIAVMTAMAIGALIGATALVFDLGQVVIAAEHAQRAADAAALAGASGIAAGASAAATERASSIVSANSAPVASFRLALPTAGVSILGPGDLIPGYRTLTADEGAVRVTVDAQVDFQFARLFGLDTATVTRSATAARVHIGGAPVAPMWISDTTSLTVGASQELHMAQVEKLDPTQPLPPGNFGWLEPNTGARDFSTLLGGYQVPPETLAANSVALGDTVTGLTGERVGQWVQALSHNSSDTGRLDRASLPPYDTQTPETATADNPRLLLVPVVEVLGGTGTGASYTIVKFAVFWLTSVRSGGKSITGTFLRYDVPGLGGSTSGAYAGVWTVRLVG